MTTTTSADAGISRLRDLQIGERREAYQIDPREIIVEPGFNPRDFSTPENSAKLVELKDSIKAQGVQQALWVRLDGPTGAKKVYLVDGERRLRATMMAIAEGAEIKTVPVIQKTEGVNNEAGRLVLALTANEGFPLSSLEVGKTYLRLRAYGWTDQEIAAKVGKSERYIRDAMAIADAPEDVKGLVKSGEVSQALAIRTVRDQGTAEASRVLKAAVAEAKANGRKQAKAPKKDERRSRLEQIQDVLERYDSIVPSDLTLDQTIKFLADIADIVDGRSYSAPAQCATLASF